MFCTSASQKILICLSLHPHYTTIREYILGEISKRFLPQLAMHVREQDIPSDYQAESIASAWIKQIIHFMPGNNNNNNYTAIHML